MSEERTQGIVVRTRLLTETSLIVQWLTADAGRISTVARGARRPKSPFRGKLDLFHEAELAFRRSARSELHTLAEVGLRETFPALRMDWRRLSQAAYGVALMELTTETETPMPEVWEEFRGFVGRVAGGALSADAVLAYEVRHLAGLGLLAEAEALPVPASVRSLVERWLVGGWSAVGMVEGGEVGSAGGGGRERTILARYLGAHLAQVVGRMPRGRGEALAGFI